MYCKDIVLISLVWLVLNVSTTNQMKYVDVKNGILRIVGYEKCKIENNGLVKEVSLNATEGQAQVTMPTYYYGAIKYVCDSDVGTLVSPPECFSCGLYCSRNDLLNGCQNNLLQTWLGIIIGFILFGIFIYLMHNYIELSLDYAYHYIASKIQQRADRREQERTARYEARSGHRCIPVYRSRIPHHPKFLPRSE